MTSHEPGFYYLVIYPAGSEDDVGDGQGQLAGGRSILAINACGESGQSRHTRVVACACRCTAGRAPTRARGTPPDHLGHGHVQRASKCRLHDVIFAKYSLANCIQRRERCKPSSGETTASARAPTPNRRLRRALYESSTTSAKFSGLSAVDGGLQMNESSGIPVRRKLSTNCRTLSEARSRRVMV